MATEKYVRYFEENAHEDTEAILTVCETASSEIHEKFRMRLEDPKMVAAIFAKIYNTILERLVHYEKEYSDFEVQIANRLCIGYSTSSDEDDEKQGNFMVYIKHINNTKSVGGGTIDYDSSAKERAVQWNTENITSQVDLIRDISIAAAKSLEDIDIRLASYEIVMPIFVLVYESLVNYLKITRREKELFEYEVNFASCFYIGVLESEDGNDSVQIRPNIASKLFLKNDSIATAKYE